MFDAFLFNFDVLIMRYNTPSELNLGRPPERSRGWEPVYSAQGTNQAQGVSVQQPGLSSVNLQPSSLLSLLEEASYTLSSLTYASIV